MIIIVPKLNCKIVPFHATGMKRNYNPLNPFNSMKKRKSPDCANYPNLNKPVVSLNS